MVLILMGKTAGLDLAAPRAFHQNTAINGETVKDQAEDADGLAWSLATGDFNGDKKSDLLVGVPDENNLNEDGVTINRDAGQVHMILGSKTGLTAAGNQAFYQGTNGINDLVNANEDYFGHTLTTGDYNKDGKADASIGISGKEQSVYIRNEGAILTMRGSSKGLDKATSVPYYQDALGFVGVQGDHFGRGVYGP